MTNFNIDYFKHHYSLSSLVQCLEEDEINQLIDQVAIKNIRKHELLFLREDNADHYFFVLDGWVKLFRETLDGTQAVVDIVTSGHIFGETAIFEDDRYPYSAEIIEDSIIAFLSLRKLKNTIETNPKLALNMMHSMTRYRKQQESSIEHLSIQNAPQRIGCFILKLVDKNSESKAINIELPYDKSLVASRLGMQPETFSRALKKLSTEIGMQIKGSKIHLDDIQKLIDYTCVACSSEFPCKDY